MTVLYALVAAVLYGLSDFIGGVASRRASVWPVGFLACLGAAFGAITIAAFDPGAPTQSHLLLGVLAGIGGGTGTAFLYRGLAMGRMGVVAPISAVGAVLIPLLVAVASGERPAPIGWLGFALALPGIWFVSREDSDSDASGAGVLDGILAGVGFGVLFAALGQVPAEAGYSPLAVTQVTAVLALVGVAMILGGDPTPRTRQDFGGLIAGVLATLAVFFFLLATRSGLLSIAAVITALYPAVTVIGAVIVLRERVHRTQGVGLALCAAAVVLISMGEP